MAKHPSKKECFAGFGKKDVIVFSWDGLQQQGCHPYQENRPQLDRMAILQHTDHNINDVVGQLAHAMNSDSDHGYASKTMFSQDEKLILVQIQDTSIQGRVSKHHLIFDASDLDTESNGPLLYIFTPPEIAKIIDIPVAILPGSKLVFLDNDLWMCTYELGSHIDNKKALHRHYFIPRDWASSENLEKCCMLEGGTLLCPRDDKIAVVKSSLDIGGF